MGVLLDGKWIDNEDYDKDQFNELKTPFDEQITTDGSTPYAPEAGRYHLYVSHGCPFAHRALLARNVMGLQDAVGLSVVSPVLVSEEGWSFHDYPGVIPDDVNGTEFLRDVYVKGNEHATTRVSVPVLWDKQTNTVVSQESASILRMFGSGVFDGIATNTELNLYPAELADAIEAANSGFVAKINFGVYGPNRAPDQETYETRVRELFDAIDEAEEVLSTTRYVCGDKLTEADIRLFCTLVRFDVAYYGFYKCNLRRIEDYPNLSNWLRDIYQQCGAETATDIDHIKTLYWTNPTQNPSGLIPIGPIVDFSTPHDRDRFDENNA